MNISVTQREAVVEPEGVLDDGHWETVAVGLRVGHGGSAYPTLIKATQPFDKLFNQLEIVRNRAQLERDRPVLSVAHHN